MVAGSSPAGRTSRRDEGLQFLRPCVSSRSVSTETQLKGHLAQLVQSARLTRERSLVRVQYCPQPKEAPHASAGFFVGASASLADTKLDGMKKAPHHWCRASVKLETARSQNPYVTVSWALGSIRPKKMLFVMSPVMSAMSGCSAASSGSVVRVTVGPAVVKMPRSNPT